MRTLILFFAVIVIASAKITKAGKLCTFCESFVGGIEEGLENEEKDMEAVS